MLFPYLGEKTKFVNFIVPKIPKNVKIYCEPFGGAFGIFFGLDFSIFRNTKFIYNDQNHLNYLLFKNLKDNLNFIELIKSTSVDKKFYKSCLKKLIKEKNEEMLALYWLVILTCSSPYEIGKESWRNNKEFEIFKLKWIAYEGFIKKIDIIENMDYELAIKNHDSIDTFFYIDPPYMGREHYYINHNFTEDSHVNLANVLNNIKGRFLLSYYYFDGLELLYPNCKFDSKVTIMGTELLIMNY